MAFDKACKNAFTEFAENEKLKSQMPIDQLEEEVGKVIKFYKLYENVNRKLIECISENSATNKELNITIERISQEKKKVDDLLCTIMKRLRESNLEFEKINREYSNLITTEMKEYMKYSKSERETLIK